MLPTAPRPEDPVPPSIGHRQPWLVGHHFIRPNALFLGIFAGFVACCLLGISSTWKNIFHHFNRFHLYLNDSSLFYVTSSQVAALGKDKLDTRKIDVVVGGNSVLYGTGQAEGHVWTDNLQKSLGEDYQVLNLGYWGASPPEFGGAAAEILSRENSRLLFVCCGDTSQPFPKNPDGDYHRFFFWDAYYKGLLTADARRDEAIASLQGERHTDRALDELMTQKKLNAWLYFDDLWNAVAYTRVGTVWNAPMLSNWYKPRRKFADMEPGAGPVRSRYHARWFETDMRIVRAHCSPDGLRKDTAGEWVEDPKSPFWTEIVARSLRSIPEQFRGRTLVLIQVDSPYYLKLLTAEDRTRYRVKSQLIAKKLEEVGFGSLSLFDGLTEEDFADRVHFSQEGGAKLAALVAGKLRTMARRNASYEEAQNP